MKKLKRWLKSNKITQGELAAYLGVTGNYITSVMKRERYFSRKAAYKVAELTNFYLWPDELLYSEDEITEYRAINH